MNSGASTPSGRAQAGISRLLSRSGHGLLALFVITLLTALLPPRPLEPTWQLQVSNALVNNGSLALLGLLLTVLASHFHPEHRGLRNRQRRLRRLAALAVAGYLLLVPLQAVAIRRGLADASAKLTNRRQQIETRLNVLAGVVANAQSAAEMQAGLRRLPGAPQIPPQQLDQPLPVLRQRFTAALAQTRQRLGNADTAPDGAAVQRLIQEGVRMALSSLALAFAFAACSTMGKVKPWHSLLDAAEEAVADRFRRALPRRRSRGERA
ncbi:MAG: HpsJ family protein [Cyanobium sp.]